VRDIGSLVNILNPSKVILSGGIGKSIYTFIPKISEIANQHTMKSMRNTYKIVISTIFEDAGILGAGSLAMEEHQAN
jgi:glucokinase